MNIDRIITPANILDKLSWKHHVSEDEVHEVLRSNPRIELVERGDIDGEDVYLGMGQTVSGRYLSVFFIHKKNNNAIIISARDMANKEKKHYGKKKRY